VDRSVFPGTIVHTVQRGDTVARLAELYGSSIDAIISANGLNSNGLIFVGQGLVVPVRLGAPATVMQGLTPVNATRVPPPTAAPPTAATYVVRPGDSLLGIAIRFNTTITALAQLNNIVNRDLIYAGQRLIVPSGGGGSLPSPLPTAIILQPGSPGPTVTAPVIRTYRVQSGDNLFNIALRFNVPLSRLIQFNGLLNANRIYVGQVLVIP
jgi:putative chitinase